MTIVYLQLFYVYKCGFTFFLLIGICVAQLIMILYKHSQIKNNWNNLWAFNRSRKKIQHTYEYRAYNALFLDHGL